MRKDARKVLENVFSEHRDWLEEAGIVLEFVEDGQRLMVRVVWREEIEDRCSFEPMEILKTEVPMVKKIVSDECWLMGERLNRAVEPKEVEPVVGQIVQRVGAVMRTEAVRELKKFKCIGDCSKCRFKPKD